MKQVIILKVSTQQGISQELPYQVELEYLLWITTLDGREVSTPVLSVFPQIDEQEAQMIASGRVIESRFGKSYAFSPNDSFEAQFENVKNALVKEFSKAQEAENSKANPNVFKLLVYDNQGGWSK